MTLEGIVKNGVVVLDSPSPLPDGTRVKVLVESVADTPRKSKLRERLLALSGSVDDLPADMARNHNHYIHGAPKQ